MRGSEDSDIDFSEIKGQCSAWYKKVSQKRFKHLPNGYVWDKWIGTAYILLCFAFLFFVANSYNFSLDYYKCGDGIHHPGVTTEDEWCDNPFYKDENWWKGMERVPPGEYGTKPGPLFNSVMYIPLILLMISAIINHALHNRRKTQ